MSIASVVLIILGVIGLIVLWKVLKPYFLRYDTTLAITGGLGSGKTLTTIKTACILIRRQRFTKYYLWNFIHCTIVNFFRRANNHRKHKYNQKIIKKKIQGKKLKLIKPLNTPRRKPMLYSNIPIHFKIHIFGRKREWNKTLEAPNIMLLKEMPEYSVVVIDEVPQFINQFNWDQPIIQKNVNEFITYFRHYIGGYLLVNAQAIDDVVVQIRRKLNQAVWCFDFKKWFFGLFYTIRMCDIMLGDQITTMSTTYIEENTKLHFGLFPPKKTYDTRCYSGRYQNIYKKYEPEIRNKKLKTNKVLRLMQYTSPLDDTTTEEMKKQQWKDGEKIWKN